MVQETDQKDRVQWEYEVEFNFYAKDWWWAGFEWSDNMGW